MRPAIPPVLALALGAALLDASPRPEAIEAISFQGAIIGPTERTALLRLHGTPASHGYRVGDGPLPGTRLTEIHEDHAIIEHEGANYRLGFPKAFGRGSQPAQPSASGAKQSERAIEHPSPLAPTLMAHGLEVTSEGHWKVVAVDPRTLTWRAGLEAGDVVVSFNGGRAEDLPPNLATYRAQLGEQPIRLSINRGQVRMGTEVGAEAFYAAP